MKLVQATGGGGSGMPFLLNFAQQFFILWMVTKGKTNKT